MAFIYESKRTPRVASAGSALFEDTLVERIAVETLLTSFAVVALCVSETFEARPSDVVTQAQRVEVYVAIALASDAGTNRSRLSEGVTIVTIFTHLTAGSCLSSRAVGADHLSRPCNLSTAGVVRARARLTVARSASQSVSMVTVQT